MPTSKRRHTIKPRSPQSDTAADRDRKIQRLAQTTATLRDGAAHYFEITRLTSLKRLCQDHMIAQRFALYLAEHAQAQLQVQPQSRSVEPDEWAHYLTLADEAVTAMHTYLAAPTAAHQTRLNQTLYRVQEAQSETDRPLGKFTVRIIRSTHLLVIEDALRCFTESEPGYWAYQTARRYTERYNPSYGTGLISESVPMLEDILQFWQAAAAPAEAGAESTDDLYLNLAYEQLHHIRRTYQVFADKQPVMLYDLQEQRIYAYPYREFKTDLSERSQTILEEQYQHAIANDQLVVFVRDNEQRRLVSYSLDIE